MKNVLFVLPFLLSLCALTCKKNPVGPPPDGTLALTVNDVNCTEAWLILHLGSGFVSRTAQLTRDTSVVANIKLIGTDTTIRDTGLSPSHTYTYTLSLAGAASVTTKATTMDTTSHVFTWTTYNLGDGSGSSALFDVAIINDTLAYAVGEIYQGGTIYNITRWDGQSWNVQQLLFQGFPPVVHSVFAINDTNIWLDPWFHWNGKNIQQLPIDSVFIGVGIKKMWGNSANLYVVGNNGFIAHYNGTTWTKIESGTMLDFQDIYGANNAQTNQTEILAIASDYPTALDMKIVKITGTTVASVDGTGLSGAINGVWFVPNRCYYIVGAGIGQKHSLQDSSPWSVYPSGVVTSYYSTSVHGNDINDVFVVGADGDMQHFNGVSWKSYRDQTYLANGSFGRVAVNGNLVIAVGSNNPYAAVAIGRR